MCKACFTREFSDTGTMTIKAGHFNFVEVVSVHFRSTLFTNMSKILPMPLSLKDETLLVPILVMDLERRFIKSGVALPLSLFSCFWNE